MASAGNRPRVIDNERLDIPDFEALSALIYAWTQAAEGMECGVGEGVLSPPAVTYEEVGVGPTRQIRLGNATLYGAQNSAAANNVTAAYPIVYDPTDPNQLQTTIDLTAYANSGGAIWWTVDLVNATLDNRRVWESGYPDGRAVAMLTRQVQRIRWTTSANFNTAPVEAGTWFRAGAFWLPTSGAPTVLWAHAYDWGRQDDLNAFIITGDNTALRWRIGQWLFSEGYNTASNVGRSFGAGRYAAQTAAVTLTILDSDWEFDPQTLEVVTAGSVGFETPPSRGLAQVNTALDAVVSLAPPLAVATIRYTGGAYVIAGSNSPDFSLGISYTSFGAGHKATITLNNIPTGEVIYGFSVQPVGGFGFPDTTIPREAVVGQNQTLPFTGDGTTDMQVEVALFYNGGSYAVVDGDFTFVVYGLRP